MYASTAAVLLLGLSLAWTALNKSGVSAFDWYVSLVLIGLAYIAFWIRPRRMLSPSLPGRLIWTIRGLLLYLIFQAIPLPLAVLQFFSPSRAALTRAVLPVAGPIGFAPISVDPAAHVLWLLTLAGCAAAFFLVRDLAFRLQNRFFLVILPLLAVATLEALLGLFQVANGADQAIGSYSSRDHYCCILELALPISITLGLFYFSRRTAGSIWPVLQAAACWTMSALLTLGIFLSLSRAGWVDSLLSVLVLFLLILFPRLPSNAWRLAITGTLLLVLAALFLFATPEAMLTRLAGTLSPESEGRLYIWRELAPLLHDFRWFGTGLMGFDPTFLKYQAFVNARRIDFAHNDFLQYLIELGLVGFLPLLASVGGIIWPLARGSWPRPGSNSRSEMRVLVIGCVASVFALFLHSLVDFNLYVPANVFAFAWILGFGSAIAVVCNATGEPAA
jgi:O-antigen ligase